MAFPEIRAHTEARICAAFRMPPILVGVKVGLDRATYSNMAEARRLFWQNTMLALYRRVESKLDADLVPAFARPGDSLCVRFDFSDVAALRESRESLERSAIAGLRAGALTINDARRRFGLEPLPDGDALFHSVRSEPVEGRTENRNHERALPLRPETLAPRNGGRP